MCQIQKEKNIVKFTIDDSNSPPSPLGSLENLIYNFKTDLEKLVAFLAWKIYILYQYAIQKRKYFNLSPVVTFCVDFEYFAKYNYICIPMHSI